MTNNLITSAVLLIYYCFQHQLQHLLALASVRHRLRLSEGPQSPFQTWPGSKIFRGGLLLNPASVTGMLGGEVGQGLLCGGCQTLNPFPRKARPNYPSACEDCFIVGGFEELATFKERAFNSTVLFLIYLSSHHFNSIFSLHFKHYLLYILTICVLSVFLLIFVSCLEPQFWRER